jgi:hypothetical protein
LIPFTEEFHLNPHEFIDRGESGSRVEEPRFVAILCFSVDGNDLIGIATNLMFIPLRKVSNQSEVF